MRLVLAVDATRVIITIGKPHLVIPAMTLQQVPKLAARKARPEERPPGPAEHHPAQSKFGDKCYTELIALQAVEIDKRLSAAFRQKNPAARAALRTEVIEEAVRQATALIRATVRPEDQERFVRDFVGAMP